MNQAEWITNMTGEAILFTEAGWFIVMQRDDGKWYWSHDGKPHGFWDTRDEAKACAERWRA